MKTQIDTPSGRGLTAAPWHPPGRPMAQIRIFCLLLSCVCVQALAEVGAPDGGAPAPSDRKADEGDELRREVDAKLEGAKKEMREEIRAQLATQSVAQGWQEEWVEQSRKLELFEIDGYLRVRPELFHKYDLGRDPDPSGYTLFPDVSQQETVAGANMRLRLEPTLNVHEQVRVKVQSDVLDNLVMGSTPDYAFSRSEGAGFGVFSQSQNPPRSGVNALKDSIEVKRAYGEVTTPVGILRFGRMGSLWGLGMLHNDGAGTDADFGDNVDRLQFVTEPFSGFYVAPMIDFNAEGPTSELVGGSGQPFDFSNADDSHTLILALARRDTEQQARAKFENGMSLFNYGLHFSYRTQKNDPVDFYHSAFRGQGGDLGESTVKGMYVPRNASLYIPDVWVKFERKTFRLELEAAAVLGTLGSRAVESRFAADPANNQLLSVTQFGGVLQGEFRFLDGALRLETEVGYASGDKAYGLGNRPGRKVAGVDNNTQSGDIDGPQYACQSTGGCTDKSIQNFRFNRAYRIDMILWREILGGLTDAIYLRPTLTYEITQGFYIYGRLIGSRTVFQESSPAANNPYLGIEGNVGARYETEDGFFATAAWGILFPLDGMANRRVPNPAPLETAQSLRSALGVKF